MEMDKRKIVRANEAGVFFGEVVKQDGTTVTMRNVRRLWYWAGAASLSELAQNGTACPSACKFPCPVEEIQIFNVIEIISVTSEAAKSIDEVKAWTKF